MSLANFMQCWLLNPHATLDLIRATPRAYEKDIPNYMICLLSKIEKPLQK
jgi:hypothetical protein